MNRFDKFLFRYEKFFFFVFVFFFMFGLGMFSYAVHEFSHKFDYKQYVEEDYLCLVNLPKLEWTSAGAYYEFRFNESYRDEVDAIGQTTEWKAYTIQIIIMLVCLLAFMSVWLKREVHGNIINKHHELLKLKRNLSIRGTEDGG